MIIKIIFIIFVVIVSIVIINDLINYYKKHKKINISFREAIDLVGLPIITFYNEGKKFNFLLDTGATISVIDSNILNDFSHEKLEKDGILFGMEGHKIDVFIRWFIMSITLKQLSSLAKVYKDKIYKEEFQVVDMSAPFNEIKAESGVKLSGILGNIFFTNYKYVLDFNSLIAYSKK